MKHEKIFDELVELDDKIKRLQNFIGKMETPGPEKVVKAAEDEDDKWGQMALDEFLSGGATEMIRHISQRIVNTDMRLRHIIEEDTIKEVKADSV